jgi:hypothetical protein
MSRAGTKVPECSGVSIADAIALMHPMSSARARTITDQNGVRPLTSSTVACPEASRYKRKSHALGSIQEDRSRAQHAAGSSSSFGLSTCARRTQRRKHATKPFDAASSMNLEKTLRNSKLHESRPPSDVTEHVVCVEAQDYRAWSRIPEKPSLLAFVSSLERASCTYDIALPTCRESQRHPRICMDIFFPESTPFSSLHRIHGGRL